MYKSLFFARINARTPHPGLLPQGEKEKTICICEGTAFTSLIAPVERQSKRRYSGCPITKGS